MLKNKRKVNFVRGRGTIASPHTLVVELQEGGRETIEFESLIIATGSSPTRLPFVDYSSPHVWDSTAALELREIPPPAAGDRRRLHRHGDGDRLRRARLASDGGRGTRLDHRRRGSGPGGTGVERRQEAIPRRAGEHEGHAGRAAGGRHARQAAGPGSGASPIACSTRSWSRLAAGRIRGDIGLENTAVEVDEKGFIKTDHQRRTAEPHIFAIGDVTGEPMLAHKASYEGRVAAEVLAGKASAYDPKCIPAVVFTDPELAWVGVTETEARNRNIPFKIAAFPWSAAGRATSLDRNDGLTKMIVDPNNELILGIGIVGVGAGELIAEGALAIEMGCTITDLKMTVHAHPTLSETVMESAEVYHGQSAHYMPRK